MRRADRAGIQKNGPPSREFPAGKAYLAKGVPGGLDGEDANVLSLAWQRPPAAGAWLLVTAADGAPGGTASTTSVDAASGD